MSFHREDIKAKAVDILEFEVGTDNPALVQRLWDLLEFSYYEGKAASEGDEPERAR